MQPTRILHIFCPHVIVSALMERSFVPNRHTWYLTLPVCAFFLAAVHIAAAHGIVDTDLPIVDNIGKCMDLESQSERLECYGELCVPDYKCAQSLLVAATEIGGPVGGINVANDLMDHRESYAIKGDGHDFAHIVGRQAAKHFGLVGEVFMQCPRDFFYGCGHGFFEIALALADSQSGAAIGVCGSLPQGQRFVCYHGVGHGLMMSHGNRMDDSLAVCNQLPKEDIGDQGCWQGVFMENVNTFIRREPLKGVFDPKDPLAPCNRMEERYHRECYLNQAAILTEYAGNSIAKASESCLKAGPTGIGPCMEGLGQFATNPGWQEVVSGKPYSEATFLPRAVELCATFPAAYVSQCETSAAGNLINYDSADLAIEFCSLLAVSNTDACYRKIVMEMNRPLIAASDRASFCAKLPAQYAALCSADSGTVTLSPEIPLVPVQEKASLLQRVWNGLLKILTAPFRFLAYVSSTHNEAPTAVDEPIEEVEEEEMEEGEEEEIEAVDARNNDIVVHYRDDRFIPSEITIPVGTTILWVNDGDGYLWPASDDHPTHAVYSLFDSKRAVTQAKPWSFTFEKAGTWAFHNHLSPDATGTITVQ